MSTATVVPCGCCRDLVEPSAAFFDTDLTAHVCDDCRGHLRIAVTELWRSSAPPAAGLPAAPICMRSVYRGADAGDNTPLPPAKPETT